MNDEELALGNRAVATPVLNGQGYAVAAVGVALQTIQFSREEIEKRISKSVIACARNISDDLQMLAMSMDVSMDHFVNQNKVNWSFNSNASR